MIDYTEQDLIEKFANIEDKIPSIWSDYETAGIELAQNISHIWDVQNSELIRVIALIGIRVRRLDLSKHIDPLFAHAGLYPHLMKGYVK